MKLFLTLKEVGVVTGPVILLALCLLVALLVVVGIALACVRMAGLREDEE